jgi:hypothetical protein
MHIQRENMRSICAATLAPLVAAASVAAVLQALLDTRALSGMEDRRFIFAFF